MTSKTKYGLKIIETCSSGEASYEVSGLNTPEEAKERGVKFALKAGWKNPKWWQFWRWGDTKIDYPDSWNDELNDYTDEAL